MELPLLAKHGLISDLSVFPQLSEYPQFATNKINDSPKTRNIKQNKFENPMLIPTLEQNNTYKNNQIDNVLRAGGLAWLGYRLDMDTKNSVRSYDLARLEEIDFWSSYKDFLLNNVNRRTALDRINYAKKYHRILIDEDAQEILTLPNEKRIHVMKALSSLSKFIGCYNRWTEIIQNYQLKWGYDNGVEIFKKIIIDENKNCDNMLKWLKETLHLSNVSKEYRNILLFTTLTGLRPSEALLSIKLIKEDTNNYLNKNKMLLEHFRFPQYFIRRTKKAYISVINDFIVELANHSTSLNSYMSLVSGIKRNNPDYKINTKYCRKIFATYLRNNGIEQEIIDLLQGRIPKSIFVRHYYRPDLDSLERVRKCLTQLEELIR